MTPHRKDALPAGDRIGAHNWMDGLKLAANILWCTTRFVIQLEPGTFGDISEDWLLEGGCESLEESLIRLTEAIVQLVARGPQCVWERGEQLELAARCLGATQSAEGARKIA
jgi:hypothetical protein